MGAVLPATVPVSGEGLPAASTGEAIHGFPVDLLWMGIPPLAYDETPEGFWLLFLTNALNMVRTSGWMKNS